MEITDLQLNHESSVPLHKQAEDMLRKLITMEEYQSGKLLPNEVDLARQLNISRNTLRQAINKLVMEGYLVRKKGFGTQVVHKSITGGVKNWLSFSQEMKQLGIQVRNFELALSYRTPDKIAARFFQIKDKQKCFVMERVRGNISYPFVYFISYFNPTIPFTGNEDFTQPLYSILESRFGITVKTSKEEISAGLAGKFLSRKLDIGPKEPVLIRKRFVYDINGVPIEYNLGYYRADSFTYTIEATR